MTAKWEERGARDCEALDYDGNDNNGSVPALRLYFCGYKQIKIMFVKVAQCKWQYAPRSYALSASGGTRTPFAALMSW